MHPSPPPPESAPRAPLARQMPPPSRDCGCTPPAGIPPSADSPPSPCPSFPNPATPQTVSSFQLLHQCSPLQSKLPRNLEPLQRLFIHRQNHTRANFGDLHALLSIFLRSSAPSGSIFPANKSIAE